MIHFTKYAAIIFFNCNQFFHYAKRNSNISIKGPKQLNDEDALEAFQKYMKAKDRRGVTGRALKSAECADDEEEIDAFIY